MWLLGGASATACGNGYGVGSGNPDASAPTDSGSSGGDATGEPPPPTDGSAGDAAPDAPKVRLVAFVSSPTYPGNQLASADAFCQLLATDAGLGGPYVAWLSTANAPAGTRVKGDGPWVRADGKVVAATRAVLFSGQLAVPLDEDERSVTVGGDAWTGTKPDGGASGIDCSGWSSAATSGTLGTIGDLDIKGYWTDQTSNPCSEAKHIYCFEQP